MHVILPLHWSVCSLCRHTDQVCQRDGQHLAARAAAQRIPIRETWRAILQKFTTKAPSASHEDTGHGQKSFTSKQCSTRSEAPLKPQRLVRRLMPARPRAMLTCKDLNNTTLSHSRQARHRCELARASTITGTRGERRGETPVMTKQKLDESRADPGTAESERTASAAEGT